jgi:hypothetical protein
MVSLLKWTNKILYYYIVIENDIFIKYGLYNHVHCDRLI